MKPIELRRLLESKPAPTLTMVAFAVNGQPRTHKFLNLPRQVVACRSKDFALAVPGSEPSYMDLPKVGELSTIPGGFRITKSDGPAYTVTLDYAVKS